MGSEGKNGILLLIIDFTLFLLSLHPTSSWSECEGLFFLGV